MHTSSRRSLAFTVLLIAFGAALAQFSPRAAAKPPGGGDGTPLPPLSYQLISIGTLGGATSDVNAINEYGDIVGASQTGNGEDHAFVWYHNGDGTGTMHDLNDLIAPGSGWHLFVAFDINEQGQICAVGNDGITATNVVLRFEPPGAGETYGQLTVVHAGEAWGYSINNSGDIVGDDYNAASRAFVYTDETGVQVIAGVSSGRAISDRLNPLDPTSAYIAGYAGTAKRYTPGTGVVDLGGLIKGGASFPPVTGSVNDSGQVVGSAKSKTSTIWHAFRYNDGSGMVDLGPASNQHSGAEGINDNGDVIGAAGPGPFPFILIDGYGMTDVRKLSADIPDNASGVNVRAINNARDIAGDIGGVAVFLREVTP